MTLATLDATTLASASFTVRTPPGQLLEAWLDGAFKLVLSDHLLSEVRRTLENAYFRSRLSRPRADGYVARLARHGEIVPLTVTVRGVASHPEDDLVLAPALSGHADYLVTGDR